MKGFGLKVSKGGRKALKTRLFVTELCAQYLQHGCGTKKASTLATDRGRIERHIKPLLGRKRVQDVTRADIKKFMQDVAQGKTAVAFSPMPSIAA